ncbi:MAG: DUF559 domain-containing protein [Acidimicrobiia bacterium]
MRYRFASPALERPAAAPFTVHRSGRKRVTDYGLRKTGHGTWPERLVWSHLRHNQLGVRFRRQHPIGPYIADFTCLSHRIVVEVDGSQHGRPAAAPFTVHR